MKTQIIIRNIKAINPIISSITTTKFYVGLSKWLKDFMQPQEQLPREFAYYTSRYDGRYYNLRNYCYDL